MPRSILSKQRRKSLASRYRSEHLDFEMGPDLVKRLNREGPHLSDTRVVHQAGEGLPA